jgi:hypothetical protein
MESEGNLSSVRTPSLRLELSLPLARILRQDHYVVSMLAQQLNLPYRCRASLAIRSDQGATTAGDKESLEHLR